MKCETAMLQRSEELAQFDWLQKENVRSYLEIGCKFGGRCGASAMRHR
jgi:hypothetical protein